MASLMPAIQSKYESLTAANFPGASRPQEFEDRAPEIWNGTQLYPPYVLFQLISTNDLLTFESDSIEEYRLVVTAFAATQDDADAIMHAIRFNGAAPSALSGFDAGTLPGLTVVTLLAMTPRRPPQPNQAGKGREGTLIFKTVMEYDISVQRT